MPLFKLSQHLARNLSIEFQCIDGLLFPDWIFEKLGCFKMIVQYLIPNPYSSKFVTIVQKFSLI